MSFKASQVVVNYYAQIFLQQISPYLYIKKKNIYTYWALNM